MIYRAFAWVYIGSWVFAPFLGILFTGELGGFLDVLGVYVAIFCVGIGATVTILSLFLGIDAQISRNQAGIQDFWEELPSTIFFLLFFVAFPLSSSMTEIYSTIFKALGVVIWCFFASAFVYNIVNEEARRYVSSPLPK